MVAKRSFAEKLRPWIPAVLWVGVIAWQSTGTFSAENTGRWLYSIVTSFIGSVDFRWFNVVHAVLRKLGHFTGYGLLGYFFYIGWRGRYMSKLHLSREELHAMWGHLWRARWAALAITMTFVVAAADEGHQTFLPSRTGVFRDVLLDSFGGAFAMLLVFVANPRRSVEVREEEKVG